MAYPDKINALVDVTGDQTLAAGGHAARHNDVNDALDEVRDALGGGSPVQAQSASTTPLVLQGASGQSANLLTVEDSAGNDITVLDENGHLGIGTDDPAYQLEIVAPDGSNGQMRIRGGSTAGDDVILRLSNAYAGGENNIFFGDQDDSDVGKIIYDHDIDEMAFYTNAGERLTIDSSGNVTVGNTLSVDVSSGNATARIASDDSDAELDLQAATGEDARISFKTGTLLRWLMRKDSATESGSDAGSDFELRAYDDSGAAKTFGQLYIRRSDFETRMIGVYDNTTATAGNVNVDSAGRLQRSTSSIKYKTDVETLEDDYADKVLDLRPVWYRSTVPSDNPEWSHYGLIAEEVAEVDPRLVQFAEQEDGTLEPEGVQYDRLVPHLINLVQRQQEQIDALTARLDAAQG